MGSCFIYPTIKGLHFNPFFWQLFDDVLKKEKNNVVIITPNTFVQDWVKYFKKCENIPDLFCFDSFLAKLMKIDLKEMRFKQLQSLKTCIASHELPQTLKHPFVLPYFLDHLSLMKRMEMTQQSYGEMVGSGHQAEAIWSVFERFQLAMADRHFPDLYPKMSELQPILHPFCKDKTFFMIGFSTLYSWDKKMMSLLIQQGLTSSWLLPERESIHSFLLKEDAKLIPDLTQHTTETCPQSVFIPIDHHQEELQELLHHLSDAPENWEVFVPDALKWQVVHFLSEHQVPVSYHFTQKGAQHWLYQWCLTLKHLQNIERVHFKKYFLDFLQLPFLHVFGVQREWIHRVLQRYSCGSVSEVIQHFHHQFPAFSENTQADFQNTLALLQKLHRWCDKTTRKSLKEIQDEMTQFLTPLTKIGLLNSDLEWFWSQMEWMAHQTDPGAFLNDLLDLIQLYEFKMTQDQEKSVRVITDGLSHAKPFHWIIQGSVQEWGKDEALSLLFFSKEWQKKLGFSQNNMLLKMESFVKHHRCYTCVKKDDLLISGFTLQQEKSSASIPQKEGLDPFISTKTIMPQMPKQSWSATSLEQFQKCGYLYYLKKELNLISFEETDQNQDHKDWGIFLHQFLELAFKKELIYSKNRKELIKLTHALWPKNKGIFWKKKYQEFLKPTIGILDQILYEFCHFPFQIMSTEMPFQLILNSQETPVCIEGKIDALFQQGLDYIVMDYKTGSKVPTGTDLRSYHSLQLSLYLLFVQQSHKSVLGAAFFHIKNSEELGIKMALVTSEGKQKLDLNRKRPVVVDAFFFKNLETHLKLLIQDIQDKKFTFAKDTSICQFCAYKTVCHYPKRWTTWY